MFPMIRMIGSMEPEICRKILRNLCEKLRAKFLTATRDYSIAKFARLDDAFLGDFKRKTSPVEGRSLQQKEKIRRKKERGKKTSKI